MPSFEKEMPWTVCGTLVHSLEMFGNTTLIFPQGKAIIILFFISFHFSLFYFILFYLIYIILCYFIELDREK